MAVIESARSRGTLNEPNPRNQRNGSPSTGHGADLDAGTLVSGGRARWRHWPGTATAPQAGRVAHEYVYLFRRGDVHGSVAATGGHGVGQRTDRGADHPRHRLHWRRFDPARASVGDGPDNGGDPVRGGVGRDGGRRRPVSDRFLRHRHDSDFAGAAWTNGSRVLAEVVWDHL